MASINYNDKRFTEIETQKKQALSESEKLYDGMIEQSDQFYQAQIDASKEWAEKQQQLQQEQTDFTIEKIEQQKEQTQKDYIKEQSGAYVDWQKQSNQYSANAEQTAQSGLTNTGFSESSQVSMWNTYQNRVATARESYNNAVLNYNNAIKDAQLQNNSALAEIAYNALQQQLELSLQGFQYKNSLLTEKANKQTEINNTYYGRYQDVVNQINTENALAEQIRQYNESMALQKKQLEEEKRQFNASLAASKSSYSSGGGSRVVNTGGNKSTVKQKTATSTFGNSTQTQQKVDYYFSNKYQPRYINNNKLESVGTIGQILGSASGLPTSQSVWRSGNKYYIWDGSARDYIDVTQEYYNWSYKNKSKK